MTESLLLLLWQGCFLPVPPTSSIALQCRIYLAAARMCQVKTIFGCNISLLQAIAIYK